MFQRARVVVAVSLASACARSPQPTTGVAPEVPVAVVTPTEARILLPLEHTARWRWNLPETRVWSFEYRWEIQIDSSDHLFGFYRSKMPRATLGEGCLADLLRTGQATVWHRTPDGGGEAVMQARLEVVSADSAIVLRITDAWTLQLLFAARPASGTFTLDSPGQPPRRGQVRFVYAAELPSSIAAMGSGPSLLGCTTPAPEPLSAPVPMAPIAVNATVGNLSFLGTIERADRGSAIEYRTHIDVTFHPTLDAGRMSVVALSEIWFIASVRKASVWDNSLLASDSSLISVRLAEDGETAHLPDWMFRLNKTVAARAERIALGVTDGDHVWIVWRVPENVQSPRVPPSN